MTIREAEPLDAHSISELLREHGLRPEGVLDPGTRYWIAERGEQIAGAIGLEPGDRCVLLRSAIVTPEERGKGVGRALTASVLAWARAAGFQTVYCFSTDAGSYWMTMGFKRCPVADVVNALADSPQVKLFATLGWLPAEEAFELQL